jgi:hypothetical protein
MRQSSGVRLAGHKIPPFDTQLILRVAVGFKSDFDSTSTLPVLMSTIMRATWFTSRGVLVICSSDTIWHVTLAISHQIECFFKTDPLLRY